MVQGIPHAEFLNLFLTPVLAKMISVKSAEIVDFNTRVKTLLMTKTGKVDKDDSVWALATPDRETLNVKLRRNTKCDICGKICAGISQLKIHITNAHSGGTRAKPRAGIKNSRMLMTTLPKRVADQNVFDLLETSESEDEEPLEITLPRRSSPIPSPPLPHVRPPALLPPSPKELQFSTASRRRSLSSPGTSAVTPAPPPFQPPPPPSQPTAPSPLPEADLVRTVESAPLITLEGPAEDVAKQLEPEKVVESQTVDAGGDIWNSNNAETKIVNIQRTSLKIILQNDYL